MSHAQTRAAGDPMFKVQTLNNISAVGLARLPRDRYMTGAEISDPDAILLRSADLHNATFGPSLKAIGRAGAGVNNIPLAVMTERGIPVFNAPGANANAVKELVIRSERASCRERGRIWEVPGVLKSRRGERRAER